MALPDLLPIFHQINERHFDGQLDPPALRWNSRLRSSAGRFIPGSRKFWKEAPAVIEIAAYLTGEEKSQELISDTMAHEMIHYWLWIRRRPYGHTGDFLRKMREMGVSRYNPVPKLRPYRYIYRCSSCEGEFPARRRLPPLACARCCEKHSNGKYDPRFKLVLERKLPKEMPVPVA